MIIGHFHYDSATDLYTGSIRTLAFSHDNIVLRPLIKSTEREPDYRVLQAGDTGEVEFGAAWVRRSERGQDYLSVLLDGPTLPQALNLALFPGDRDDAATLVWNRPARKPESQRGVITICGSRLSSCATFAASSRWTRSHFGHRPSPNSSRRPKGLRPWTAPLLCRCRGVI